MRQCGKPGESWKHDIILPRLHAMFFNRESGRALNLVAAKVVDVDVHDFGRLGVFWRRKKGTMLLRGDASVGRWMLIREMLLQ